MTDPIATGPVVRTGPLSALFVVTVHDGVPADEWRDWYDTEHIPQRLALPGWLTGSRWTARAGGSISVGMFDLAGPDVLHEEAYQAMRGAGATPWTRRIRRLRGVEQRYECIQLLPGDAPAPADPGHLYLFRTDVDPAAEGEFNDWYDREHLPELAAVDGVRCARRFRATNADDGLHRYLAAYHLDSPEVITSTGWKAALRTPWTREIGRRLRNVAPLLLDRAT